ncbi:FAD:protein FMN transferase [Prosthecomicrobium sp. N25]|uniref:FAD:protein FMN transferase n=1 Tax=Prosthecomicrobium sp. N25 TaxID=3129254 RepID=UPI0030775D31
MASRAGGLTRRRFLTLSAAFGAAAGCIGPAAAGTPVARWHGFALGAGASITLAGLGPAEAAPVFAAVEAELARLEAIFSLYRTDSALVRLNRDGRLPGPDADLLACLAQAAVVHRLTEGLFDPTVQPVFATLAEHFAAGGEAGDPGLARRLERAGALVGFDRVTFDDERVAFADPGMALTLNGIAQGYATDRIAALLEARGCRDVLVDIGETRALGRSPEGRAWRAGIAEGPQGGAVAEVVELRDRALATSMPLGTVLDPAGAVGHILHPRLGIVRPAWRRVSVVAASAALADALSTGLCLADPAAPPAMMAGGADVRIIAARA